MTGPLLVVEDLVKRFPVIGGALGARTIGHVHAVDGISFTIKAGETLAVVGESGCGKSTTARLVLRLFEASSGTVRFDGRPVDRLSGKVLRWFRKNVQAVFQDPWASLSPRMRVRNIVAEALVVNERVSKREVDMRVTAALERVGLKPFHGNLFPHEFSGGQRQRIALASALITRPKLLVLDEPVSALDVSVRAQVINLLKDVQADSGTAFLMISHDLETVRFLADSVAVMYMGQIVEQGSSTQIFEQPRHPYTRALFASVMPFHPRQRKAEPPIQGEMPSLIAPPSGCRFRTRCPHASAVCGTPPPKVAVEPGHLVSCHLYADSDTEIASADTRRIASVDT